MHTSMLKHKDKIVEAVNAKIEDICHDVRGVIEDDELYCLLKCVKVLKKIGDLHHIDHQIKMDHETAGNPRPYKINPGTAPMGAAAAPRPN